MKSNIPWGNHIMRKFGGNIRKEIENIGKKQVINISVYRTLGIVKKAAWFDRKGLKNG